jgi:Family of unknown function (DUF6624)
MDMNRATSLLFSFFLIFPAVGYCDDDHAADPIPTCSGAVEWIKSHPTRSVEEMKHADEARKFTDAALRRELQERAEAAMRVRKAFLAEPNNQFLIRNIVEVDTANLVWMRWLARSDRLPSTAQVGETGVYWMWFLVLHAGNPEFQLHTLPLFAKSYASGELPAENLAMLTDKTLLANGKPQRYGTRFEWQSGEYKLENPGDPARMDTERTALGLMPLADYTCFMREKARTGSSTTSYIIQLN